MTALGCGLYNLPFSHTLSLTTPRTGISNNLNLQLPEFHLPENLSQRWRQDIKYEAVDMARKTDVFYQKYLKEDYAILTKFIVFLQTVKKGIPKNDELLLWQLAKKFMNQMNKMLIKIESALYMEEENVPHVVYEVDEIWLSSTKIFNKYMRDVALLKEVHFFFEDMINRY